MNLNIPNLPQASTAYLVDWLAKQSGVQSSPSAELHQVLLSLEFEQNEDEIGGLEAAIV